MSELTDRQRALGWTQAHLDAEEARVRIRQAEIDAKQRAEDVAAAMERSAERARLAKRYMLELVAKNVDDVHTGQLRMIVSESTLAQYAVSCADAILGALEGK